jgi:hypothetical protein
MAIKLQRHNGMRRRLQKRWVRDIGTPWLRGDFLWRERLAETSCF